MAKTVTMNFPGAMQAIIDGHEVKRLGWKDKRYYLAVFGNRLCLHKPDGAWHWWLVSDSDMKSTDWVVDDPEWGALANGSASPDA